VMDSALVRAFIVTDRMRRVGMLDCSEAHENCAISDGGKLEIESRGYRRPRGAVGNHEQLPGPRQRLVLRR
jgi:hypothetical protein